ncbi:hypothetical protein ABPG72_018069 [Tetrahymena utriculariae]
MKLKVQVEDLKLNINVGQGLNDFVWLALAAAKLYGKTKYPPGNYLPAILKIFDYVPNPRQKICNMFKDEKDINDDSQITVELYKPNMIQTDEHKKWFEMAFGKERNKMNVSFNWWTDKPKDRRKDITTSYFLRLKYGIYKELRIEFNPSDYRSPINVPLVEQELGNIMTYNAEMNLPFGEITFEVIQVQRDEKTEEEKQTTVQSQNFKFEVSPSPISQEEILKKIKDGMKIPEHLSQQLQQQEAEIKKEAQTGSFCPFTFETLWVVIENNPKAQQFLEFQDKIKEKINQTISENMNKIYEIFFQYSMLYIQKTDKKDEIAIPIQDVMHFLKFYEVMKDSQNVFSFIEFYGMDDKRNNSPQASLDLSNGVKFPEFIFIILKATEYIQTTNLMSDGESFDMSLDTLVKRIVSIDNNEDEFNEFQKHMKYNITLMNFIRENSSNLIQIFVEKLQDSLQIADKKFHMLKEEVKALITEAGFKGDNLDEIVNTCFQELLSEDKYQGFEGIFFYEYLQVMQWLSLVLIADSEEDREYENDNPQDEVEEGVDILIEKFRFFLSQFK